MPLTKIPSDPFWTHFERQPQTQYTSIGVSYPMICCVSYPGHDIILKMRQNFFPSIYLHYLLLNRNIYMLNTMVILYIHFFKSKKYTFKKRKKSFHNRFARTIFSITHKYVNLRRCCL